MFKVVLAAAVVAAVSSSAVAAPMKKREAWGFTGRTCCAASFLNYKK